VYKWATDRRRLARPRSASYAGAQPSRAPAFANIHEPNGFRRNYVLTQAEREGVPKPRMLRSFVEFIYVFGHFVRAAALGWCRGAGG
jgi:proton-coupled amino acid transporter